MQRQVFNNHQAEFIVSLCSFFNVPLGFPGVLLYRPLQSLSVIAMDSVLHSVKSLLNSFQSFERATSVFALVSML